MGDKNVIYEGAPHGNLEPTQFEHFLMLNVISTRCCGQRASRLAEI